MRKGEVKITLTKDGCKDITVRCSAKIKLHPMMAFITIGYGMPPMQVKPIDWKGVGIAMAGYLAIFLACTCFLSSVALGVVVLGAVVAANIIYNRNYFFNYIQKKLREGYQVLDQEQQQILTEAGVLPLTEKASRGFKLPLPGNVSLDKKKLLPIAGGAVAVVLLLAMCTGGGPIDQMLDDMESTLNALEKLVVRLEDGKISGAEYEEESTRILMDMAASFEKYEAYSDVNPTLEQAKRLEELEERMDQLSNYASLYMMRYYY